MESNIDTRSDADKDRDTESFLKTDGPKTGAFASTIPAFLLEGQPPAIKELLNLTSVSTKQNEYVIEQVEGLKTAHKTMAHHMKDMDRRLQEGELRFANIDKTLKIFTDIHAAWLAKRLIKTKIALGIGGFVATLIAAPLAVAWFAHHAGWLK